MNKNKKCAIMEKTGGAMYARVHKKFRGHRG